MRHTSPSQPLSSDHFRIHVENKIAIQGFNCGRRTSSNHSLRPSRRLLEARASNSSTLDHCSWDARERFQVSPDERRPSKRRCLGQGLEMSPHLTQRHSSGASPSDHRARRPPSLTLPAPRDSARSTADHALRDGRSDGDLQTARRQFSHRSYQNPMGPDPAWRNSVRQRATSQTGVPEYDDLAARRLMLLERHRRDQRPPASQVAPLSVQDVRRLGHRPTIDNRVNGLDPAVASRTVSGQSINTAERTDGPHSLLPNPLSTRKRSHGAIELPKWQPDEGILECPICGTTFTFWYRKHHCRKCGRVVCAGCSPHRITIPRQFIVHPPEMANAHPVTSDASNHEIIDLTGDDESELSTEQRLSHPLSLHGSGSEGGEEVRLCNPCVPDPNPSPHIPRLPTYMPSSWGQLDHASLRRDGFNNEATSIWSRGNMPPPSLSTIIPHAPVRRNRPQGTLFGSSFPFAQATENFHGRSDQPYQPNSPIRSVDLRHRPLMSPTDHVSVPKYGTIPRSAH